MKNITRYDGGATPKKGFFGWRLCITRKKQIFVRYFTDKEYGGEKASLEAALQMRAEMEEALRQDEADPATIFADHRKVRKSKQQQA